VQASLLLIFETRLEHFRQVSGSGFAGATCELQHVSAGGAHRAVDGGVERIALLIAQRSPQLGTLTP
jgi:hypothetical protein